MRELSIGIDLGGTKTEIIVLEPSGQCVHRKRVDTVRNDYPATLDTICELIREAEIQLHCHATVGVATPGAISQQSGLIKNANSTCLIGKPIDKDLEHRLQRPIYIENDANCFALSEAIDGAAAHYNVVFAVIIGTGTGGAIAWNKTIIRGANHIAGEWGHNPLPWKTDGEHPGPACYCGMQGCIETYLSGAGMVNAYFECGGEPGLEAKTIAEYADRGEPVAQAAMAIYCDRMSRALASVINILDPDVIVLGGGLSNIKQLYTDVPRMWQKYVFSDRVDTHLLAPKHGDSSGVRGAAWLGAGQRRI